MTIDRLRAHYGFTRMPFSKDLAPQMLHTHRSHAEAVARITWCIDERVMGVVTGEVGAGKTVAVRGALAGIDASRHSVIYLGNPTVGARGLYSTIVSALGGIPRFHRASLIPQATEALATEEHERGRRVVLIFDEAHLLDADQLEGLRLLSGAEMDAHSPFACLLVGQPTLRRRIRLGAFAALDQRVALRYAMAGMEPAETADYVGHHLKIAGRTDTLFSDDALALIHQVSRGLPRAVNNLAVQSLVAAFAESKAIVDESSTRAAITEVTAE
jgi:type II secretory pathway predicted ATPase ExeA